MLFQVEYSVIYSFLILGLVSCDNSSMLIKLIVNGYAVDIVNFPSSAAFYNRGYICGATILCSRSVLTAAHCFMRNNDIKEMHVRVGSRHLEDYNGQMYGVAHFKTHPRFRNPRFRNPRYSNDIAVIFLKEHIKFSKTVKKAVLVNTDKWMNDNQKNFLVCGWGRTVYGGNRSIEGLLKTHMSFVSWENCGFINNRTIAPDIFCLYGEGQRGVCQGDSGGGVMWNGMVVGVVSHGNGCEKKPTMFSNVWYFRAWIEETIARSTMQEKPVGAIPVAVESFPSAASLLHRGHHLCGATIMKSRAFVTAAHCFDDNIKIENLLLRVGTRYKNPHNSAVYKVIRFMIHPKYKPKPELRTSAYDIAVVFSAENIKFDSKVGPILLVNSTKWMNMREVFMVTGWGRTKYRGKPEDVLTMTLLRYKPSKLCELKIGPEMLCLYWNANKGVCQDGAGVVWNGTLVAIKSNAERCTEKGESQVFTNVWYVREWIEDTVNNYFRSMPLKNGISMNHTLEGKIVGGEPVMIERYPSSVVLFNRGALCGSSVVNSWCVVTAAHCFDHNADVEDMTIHAGSRHLYDHDAKVYHVAEVVIHPDYNKGLTFACDIAMVFLAERLVFGKKVKKVVIVNTNRWMDTRETNFDVTGWGWTKYGGPISEMGLMMVHLQYVSPAECGRFHDRKLTPDMFCLYGDTLRDACKGDSGGGVLWRGMLVGIVSHGDGCAKKDKPSVYSNVWYFRKWIEHTVNNYFNKYCLEIS